RIAAASLHPNSPTRRHPPLTDSPRRRIALPAVGLAALCAPTMRAAVIVFPGSNREHDIADAIERASGTRPALIWHKDSQLPPLDLIVLPGGFAYGDYLRTGAIAARAPVMREIARRAEAGTPLIGVCNGFQILCEAGLLPGVLLCNAS